MPDEFSFGREEETSACERAGVEKGEEGGGLRRRESRERESQRGLEETWSGKDRSVCLYLYVQCVV